MINMYVSVAVFFLFFFCYLFLRCQTEASSVGVTHHSITVIDCHNWISVLEASDEEEVRPPPLTSPPDPLALV